MSSQRPPRRPARPDDDDLDPYDYESIFEQATGPEPKPWERISRGQIIITVAVVIVLILVFSGLNFVHKQIAPTGSHVQVNVEVPSGATFSDVASLLSKKKVVANPLVLRIYAKVFGTPNVRAGEYAFETNLSDKQVLSLLKGGPKPSTDRLVIPEGFRLTQIAERVGQLPGMSATKFYQDATDGSVHSKYQPAGSNNLEGLLYPDTYLLSSSDTEMTLLQRMVNEFENEAAVLDLDSSAASIGHTPYETVIIASMIEAEAKVPADRGKISQVIENRLFKPMDLQIDATVLYALGNTKNSVSISDTKVNSPYNTYQHQGLPPGPIDSPGAASLQAALQPTPGPWLYYVVTGADGSHSFATTYAEQNANIALAKSRGLR